jgi:hypothetical protein
VRLPVPQRSQFGAGALVIAALAVGQVINSRLPSDDNASRPFEIRSTIDKPVHMRSGDLTFTLVEGAQSIARASKATGGDFTSNGVILVVSFDFTPQKEPSSITYGELRMTDGSVTTFSSSGQRSTIHCPSGPVGVTAHCDAVVEAAPSTLAGAKIALAPSSIDPRFDSMAVLDLKISEPIADEWSHRPGPIDIPNAALDGMP